MAYLFKMGHALHSQSARSQAYFFKARAPAKPALCGLRACHSLGEGGGTRGMLPSSARPCSESLSFPFALANAVRPPTHISMQCLLMLHAILKPNLNLSSLVSAVTALWSSCDT